MQEIELAPNATIFTEGEISNGMYAIMAGEAAVMRTNPVTGEERELLRLGEGDVFGENGMDNPNSKRNATVRATQSGVRVLFLERENFLTLVRTQVLHVKFAKRKRGVAVRAGNDDGGDGDQFHHNNRTSQLLETMVTVDKSKTDIEFAFLFNAVRQTLLFGALPEDHVKAIVEEMWKGEISKDTVLIKQGDMGNHVYVLEKGNFDVFIWDGDDEKIRSSSSTDERQQKKVDYKVPGDVFGDIALMYNAPRNATCTAEKDSVVWMVDRFTFQRIARDVGAERLLAYQAFLAQVSILTKLNSAERMKIAEALEEVEFGDGEVVYEKRF